MTVQLRPYQQDVYDRARTAFATGAKGVCCVLPCRSGKSYIMAKMIENAKGNVLVLAHRNHLIKQHIELLIQLGIYTEKVRVESVFTEARHLGNDSPRLIIIDEAHLSEASSYRKVCEHYRCKVVGFTASPARLDGKPLTLFDTLITGISAQQLIDQGNISAYDYYAPDLGIDTDNVELVAGEYNNGQLSELMCESAIYGDVLKYYRELGDNRQAIAYCTSVKHSQKVAGLFNENGISAVSIDGGMSQKERSKRMELFSSGKVKILANCNLISEGITLPNASVGLLLRPTCSLPLFIQQSCRVLTPVEGKRAVIIDFVNNVQRHGLPTEEHQWSLGEPLKKREQFNEDGTLVIKQCDTCFRCYQGKRCPYCGAIHIPKGRELKQIKDVELQKIETIRRETEEQKRRDARWEQGQARTYEDLVKLAKSRGYKNPNGWAYFIMKGRG